MKYIILVLWTFSLFLLMFSSFPFRVECRPTRAMGPGPPVPSPLLSPSPLSPNTYSYFYSNQHLLTTCPVLEGPSALRFNPWPEHYRTDITVKIWESPIVLEGTARSRSEVRSDGTFGVTFDLHRVVKGDAPLLRRRKQFRLQFLDNPTPALELPPRPSQANRNRNNLHKNNATQSITPSPPSRLNKNNNNNNVNNNVHHLRSNLNSLNSNLNNDLNNAANNFNSHSSLRSVTSTSTRQLQPQHQLQLYHQQQQSRQLQQIRQQNIQNVQTFPMSSNQQNQNLQSQRQRPFQSQQQRQQMSMSVKSPEYGVGSRVHNTNSSLPYYGGGSSSASYTPNRNANGGGDGGIGLRRSSRNGRNVATTGSGSFTRGVISPTNNGGKCLPPKATVKTGRKYYVFAAKVENHFIAVFSPELANKRNTKALEGVLCKGCGQAPSVVAARDVQLQVKERLRLRCRLRAGNPIPVLTWYKDGRPVNLTDTRFRLRPKRRQSILVIRRAKEMDAGVYKCEAKNVFGSAHASVRVTLPLNTMSRPQLPPKPPNTRPSSLKPVGTTPTTLWPLASRECPFDSYCLNGGTCSYYETIGEYVCQCAEGYKGQRCDTKDIPNSGSMYLSSYFCIFGTINPDYPC